MIPPLLLHWLGLDGPNFTPALFWAGPAGSLGLFGGAAVWARHKTCRERGCWRLGHVRHGAGESAVLCHVHHERVLAAAPPPDQGRELLIHLDALGEAITASTRAAERQSDVLADLAETVRASLATHDQSSPTTSTEGR